MANQKDISSIKNNIPISEKYMLTIYEASAYFNIGVKKLRRMAENNEGRFLHGKQIFDCKNKV